MGRKTRRQNNSVKAKVIEGNVKSEAIEEKILDSEKQSYKELVANGSKVIKDSNVGWLFSRLDHPEDIKYGTDTIRVSPRANNLRVANHKLLGDLPSGIFLKK